MNIAARTAAWSGEKLPYDPLTYLQSSNDSSQKQYFITPFIHTPDTVFTITFSDFVLAYNWNMILGSRTSYYATNAFTPSAQQYGNLAWNIGGVTNNNSGKTLFGSNKRFFSASATTLILDDFVLSTGASTMTNNSLKMFLLAANENNNMVEGGVFKCKLYNAKIYDADTLLADYIPCLYQGVPCLWDLVSSTPLYKVNNGSVDFTYT